MTIYDRVTANVITKLEQGVAPWHKGWKDSGIPTNYITNKPYHGINTLLLSMMGYSSQYWMTYNQTKQKGGQVKTGEHATMIVYFDFIESKYETVTDKNGIEKPKKFPMLRYYNVFNILQTTLKAPENKVVEHTPITEADQLISKYANDIRITHDGGRAFYSPSMDFVNVPKMADFEKIEEYYAVMFHELTHSTGHASRLNRDGVVKPVHFASHEYSKEELVAEMGACFMSSITGIERVTLDNSVAYIQSWIRALKNDKTMLITAGGQAQKAVDYIINYQGK